MATRTAQLVIAHVTNAGVVKSHSAMTIGEAILSTSRIRVLPDPNLPNSTGYPTVAAYLALEENDGYELRHLDQTYVITCWCTQSSSSRSSSSGSSSSQSSSSGSSSSSSSQSSSSGSSSSQSSSSGSSSSQSSSSGSSSSQSSSSGSSSSSSS